MSEMKWLKSTQFLEFSVVNRVARITLNRPDKRNALSKALLTELDQALHEADDRVDVRCVILQGAGKDFCAGYDVVATPAYSGDGGVAPQCAAGGVQYRGSAKYDDDAWGLERMQDLRMFLFDMHKPVIARVHGNCIAGGTDLALLCDFVIAANEARIGFPATRMQGSPPNHMWLYHVGPQWTKRMLMTGDLIRGRDAARIGLALKSVPMARLDAEVDFLAARLAAVDADLLAAQKRITNTGLELMGARTMQRLAAEMDARAHLSEARDVFRGEFVKHGLKAALKMRDEPFGDEPIELDDPSSEKK